MLLEPTPLLYAGVFLFGLLIGSFLNVVIYRLPVMFEREWRQQCHEFLDIDAAGGEEEVKIGLATPASSCPHCGHSIRPWENIPIVSYLLLRGRCSSCSERISVRYPLVELTTAILFTVVAWTDFGRPAFSAA